MPDALWVLYPWMHLAGRFLFSLGFLVCGAAHLVNLGQTVRYLEQKRIPGPRPVAVATGLMLLAGGLLVLLGWSRFIGAGLLFLVLFPGAFALHPFWNETDPLARRAETAQFFMTLGLSGAALVVAFYGYQPWPLSMGG